MTHSDRHSLLSLPVPERVALAQELWESVHADACAAPFTPEQLAEVDRRVAALDSGEMHSEPWNSLRDGLREEL